MSELVPAQLRPEPKRDRYGRYLLPDPETGKEKAWTRATTFAKTISDMYGLGKWQERMVAKGIATRSDLYALAAATPVDDKAKFDRICSDAKEAAKASSGANLGTALHAFTEQIDAGQAVVVPEPWNADIEAYSRALVHAHIKIHPQWIERIVLIPQYGVAGTLDRIITLPDRRRVIADVKTGKDLGYSWGEIAVQLSLYANATHIINPATNRPETMPQVDQDVAVVLHLPVGQGRCDLYTVNIAAGWETAYICRIVREWRQRKDIAQPYGLKLPPLLIERINTADSREAVEALWREYIEVWNPDFTEAAKIRIAALDTPARTAGGTREQAQEGARV